MNRLISKCGKHGAGKIEPPKLFQVLLVTLMEYMKKKLLDTVQIVKNSYK